MALIGGCRATKRMGGMAGTVLVVVVSTNLVLWLMMCCSRAHGAQHVSIDISCPPQFTYVYPYGSHCSLPARFFTEAFQLFHPLTLSGLQPEWDETNSTYYVRLASASSASAYTVLYNLSAAGGMQVENVYQNFPALLQNAESTRYLAWREEGDDEHFLIETDSFDEAATFWFFEDQAPASAQLPCILLLGARCEAYNLMSLPRRDVSQAVAGWLLYEESGVNYIKLATPQSRGDVPILLGRISTTGASAAAAQHVNVLSHPHTN